MERYTFLSLSPVATLNLGKRIGERLKAGSIISLIGELGCGKTLFTKGICLGVGIPERHVNSPTFAFVNQYTGRLPVFHIDLYRLNTLDEVFEIGALDYLTQAESGIIVVEWAEKILSLLPDSYLKVAFAVLSPRKRQLTLTGFGARFTDLLEEIGNW